MSLDISFPRSLGLSDSESELEELELLPPGRGPRGSTILPGGLLSLDSVILPLGIEPLPDCALHGGGGRSYNESVSSSFGRGTLPYQACCSRILSMTEVILMPLQDCWANRNWTFSSSPIDWSSSWNDFCMSSHSCWETADALTWSCCNCSWRYFNFCKSSLTLSWSILASSSQAFISVAHCWQLLLNFSCLAAWSL
jgi:hypothetical protein